uniref:Uncharacterized protein n=1 Tax=Chromera velia CCMP2878 TaxID=1169474 RepID=A0A0G4HEH2_9ALVE|eukprot:Cvel_6543.t1-p1 / transcript=Cvel_6543.t1 / gene=Cvel_6543 / organism=Chromera_velia_CCMP2878 / gene_product=hypothetical protein / transcript_product=hypothetical protein / location=Cvel_scaffold322:30029-36960(-) / protein_length=216 / sequence_SO=supercontig / SO=protein_coding / is_pseudo=false
MAQQIDCTVHPFHTKALWGLVLSMKGISGELMTATLELLFRQKKRDGCRGTEYESHESHHSGYADEKCDPKNDKGGWTQSATGRLFFVSAEEEEIVCVGRTTALACLNDMKPAIPGAAANVFAGTEKGEVLCLQLRTQDGGFGSLQNYGTARDSLSVEGTTQISDISVCRQVHAGDVNVILANTQEIVHACVGTAGWGCGQTPQAYAHEADDLTDI